MFTGLIEETGTVQTVRKDSRGIRLVIASPGISKEVQVGDSVATNGVCLTVTNVLSGGVEMDVMEQTLRNTAISTYKTGQLVNLERAMRADGRLDGHLVSGHVDGLGTIRRVVADGFARQIWIQPEQTDLLKYIVPKGSIAVSGISLTVADVTESQFMVSIIPHTAEHTTLHTAQAGQVVHLETDILAKYVEKLLISNAGSEASSLQRRIGQWKAR